MYNGLPAYTRAKARRLRNRYHSSSLVIGMLQNDRFLNPLSLSLRPYSFPTASNAPVPSFSLRGRSDCGRFRLPIFITHFAKIWSAVLNIIHTRLLRGAHRITQHPPPSLFSNVVSAARVAASNTSSTPSPVRLEHSRYFLAPISSFMSLPAFVVVNLKLFFLISSTASTLR